jgi:hypothetical protein
MVVYNNLNRLFHESTLLYIIYYILVAAKMEFFDFLVSDEYKALKEFFKLKKHEYILLRKLLPTQKTKPLDPKVKDESSESLRQQGNRFFVEKHYSQAVQMYTQSIAAAIEGPLASMAYLNR